MANEEHLRILKGGVDRWNQWRDENPEINPDLGNLRFDGANLDRFNFRNTVLWGSNFGGSSLRGAILIRAFLQNTYLFGVQLTNADLRQARLNGANLGGANLHNADLSEADLSETRMDSAYLWGAKLREANLTRAYLAGANFAGTDLSGALLLLSTAAYTNFEGAVLTGVCIQDWAINESTNFNQVVCDYFYRKLVHEPEERRPSDTDKILALGDFAKLVQKSLETVDLIFNDGIDWKTFFLSFGDLQVEYGDSNLSIQAIENKNDAFVIRLNVPPDADKGAIEHRHWELYEAKLAIQEAQYLRELKAKDQEIITLYRKQSEDERRRNTRMEGILETMAEKNQSSKVTQNFHAPVGGVAGNVEGDMNVYSIAQHQDLAEAATKIQALLAQLQSQGVSSEVAKQKVASDLAVQAQSDQTFRGRLVQWGESLQGEIPTGVVTEVAIEVIRWALKLAGIPTP